MRSRTTKQSTKPVHHFTSKQKRDLNIRPPQSQESPQEIQQTLPYQTMEPLVKTNKENIASPNR